MMLQLHHVVTALGKAVVGSWRGTARPRRGSGAAVARLSSGAGVHARAWVLAFLGRGMAVPCAGHRHPEPATQRSGGGRRRLRGALRHDGSLHKKRYGGQMGEGVLGPG
jgi:hypothetical protein